MLRQVAVLLGHICQQTCFSPHQRHKQWKTRHHMANTKTLEVHLYTTSARGWSYMENAIGSTWYKRGFKLKMHTWHIRHMQSLHIIYLSKYFDHVIQFVHLFDDLQNWRLLSHQNGPIRLVIPLACYLSWSSWLGNWWRCLNGYEKGVPLFTQHTVRVYKVNFHVLVLSCYLGLAKHTWKLLLVRFRMLMRPSNVRMPLDLLRHPHLFVAVLWATDTAAG